MDQEGQHVYKSVANPITKEFQQELTGAILKAYEKREKLGKDGMKMGDGIGEPKFNISVNVYEKEGSHIKGLARMYIEDSFVVQNISIVEGKNGLFVSMPAYKNGRGDYQDIAFPITKDFRSKLYGAILDTYKVEREKPRETKTKEEAKSNDKATSNVGFIDLDGKDSLPFR